MQFGEGKDVVFLHGWGANSSAFLFVAKSICASYRVTLIDFFGFGKSDEPKRVYDVNAYAKGVRELLDKTGIERAVLVGHSFGGRVALELAAYYPQIVDSLVLIDSAGIKPRRGIKYYAKVLAHKLLKKIGKSGLSGSSDYRELSPVMKRTFINVVNYDQRKLLKLVHCPTAVFWGAKDKDTPLYMYRCFLKHIKGANGFILDGGHFSYVDDARAFLAIFSAFLNEKHETHITTFEHDTYI